MRGQDRRGKNGCRTFTSVDMTRFKLASFRFHLRETTAGDTVMFCEIAAEFDARFSIPGFFPSFFEYSPGDCRWRKEVDESGIYGADLDAAPGGGGPGALRPGCIDPLLCDAYSWCGACQGEARWAHLQARSSGWSGSWGRQCGFSSGDGWFYDAVRGGEGSYDSTVGLLLLLRDSHGCAALPEAILLISMSVYHTACQEWVSAIAAAKDKWAEGKGSPACSDRAHAFNRLWRRVMQQARGYSRPARDAKQAERDEKLAKAGKVPKKRSSNPAMEGRWRTALAQAHENRFAARRLVLARLVQAFVKDWNKQPAKVAKMANPGGGASLQASANHFVVELLRALSAWGEANSDWYEETCSRLDHRIVQAMSYETDFRRVARLTNFSFRSLRFQPGWVEGAGFHAHMGIREHAGFFESWRDSLLPLNQGRRHSLTSRKVDLQRLRALKVHTYWLGPDGEALVSARHLIADMARRGLPVGAPSWGRRARALLRGALCPMITVEDPVPTLVASASQLLFRVSNGRMAILAVEEEASIMGIELNEPGGFLNMLGRILVGLVFVVGPIETVIVDGFEVRSQRQHETVTALQAHAAIADSMHVGLTSAVIRWAWLILVQRLNVCMPVGQEVMVHTACAGMVNAGYLAAERALQGLQLTPVLSVASEKCTLRRDALQMQYPDALLVADAAMDGAYARHSHIFIASWPCKAYSAAQVDSSVSRKVWEERAWYNTRLICYIV